MTFVEFNDDGNMTSADVQVSQAIYRGPQCQRTVTHETAHAIGFLGHTSDGGLMDPDGGNGDITPLVAGVLTRPLPPRARDPVVSAEVKAVRPGAVPGARTCMTFVYPVRP